MVVVCVHTSVSEFWACRVERVFDPVVLSPLPSPTTLHSNIHNDAITTQEGWSLNSIHDEQRELQDDDDKLLEDIHIIPDYPSTRLLEVKKNYWRFTILQCHA